MPIKTKKTKLDLILRLAILILSGLLSIFIITLSVSTLVNINNKIKEGRYIGQEVESKNTITVSDKSEVYAKPDLATTDFSVITEAKTVTEALTQNSEKMNKIINFVKRQGVDEVDLKTTNFNIYPRYEYEKITYPTGKRILAGYEIQQTLQVKIRDLSKISSILQGVADAGANQIGDLQFTIDKQDEFKQQARNQAIKKAKEKAEDLAKQLGVHLVRITDFSEGTNEPYVYRELTADAKSFGGGEMPQIETGQNKIEITVSITYEIN